MIRKTEPNNNRGFSPQAAMGILSEYRGAAFLGLVCVVMLLANLGSPALFDPDEGRNAEKAREILILNDWVTPHHNFLPTLDKPIFYYWLVALSLKFFGVNEAAARLPSVLSALGCILLVYLYARRRWGVGEALWSSLVLVTSLGFFVFARVVIFDMPLTFFLTLALLSFHAAAYAADSHSRRLHSLVMYAAIGVGTLIKGAVAVAIPGMIIVAYLALTRRWSLLLHLGVGRGALVFSAVVLPWYLWAEARNPGYLDYFLWQEHIARYLTPEFDRSRVWYYFMLVLLAGFFPWSLLLPSMVRDLWRKTNEDSCRFLALWALLPIVFFSLSSSQLPQYILPVFPALALIAGRFLAERRFDSTAVNLIILPVMFVAAIVLYLFGGAIWPPLLARSVRTAAAENLLPIAVCGVFLFAILVIFFKRGSRWRSWWAIYVSTATGLALFFVMLGELTAEVSLERSSKPLARTVRPFITPGDQVVFYDTFLPGMAFYLDADQPIWIVQREGRERIMGSNYLGESRPEPAAGHGQPVYSFREFAQQWKRPDLVLRVIVKEKNLQRMMRDVGAAPRVLAKYDEYLLVANP
jgi:4-amino-4-deoxy-L-arabinose transferase-like glycosyltransferase